MKLTTRDVTLCALLTALALALSYLENFFPLSLVIPLPGVKLGLANVVTLLALYVLGPGRAMLILLARCLLGAVFAGNMNALIFSLMGGVTAMAVMILLSRGRRLSVYGVSVGGAAGAIVPRQGGVLARRKRRCAFGDESVRPAKLLFQHVQKNRAKHCIFMENRL